jgi:hypothetical protein
MGMRPETVRDSLLVRADRQTLRDFSFAKIPCEDPRPLSFSEQRALDMWVKW